MPSATTVSAKELDARAPVECVDAAARKKSAWLGVTVAVGGDVHVCIAGRCSAFDVATRRRRVVDNVVVQEPPSAAPCRSGFVRVVTDGVEVTLPGAPTKPIPVAGARAPRAKSWDPGTPAELNRDGRLLAVVFGEDAIVYDVKTTKFVRRFRSSPHACFFGSAFYALGFHNPRSPEFIAYGGGVPDARIDCSPRDASSRYMRQSPHLHLSGETWAFLANDGTKLIIEGVSTHESPIVVELQPQQEYFQPAIVESHGRVVAVLTGAQLGDVVVVDPATGTSQRYPVPTCAADAG